LAKISNSQFHSYMTRALPKQLKTEYKNHQILTEADLQATVRFLISRFLWRRNRHYKVVSNPYCESLCDPSSRRGIHPDLIIFDCEDEEKPQARIVIELKERKGYKDKTIEDDLRRGEKCVRELPCKRAYIVFVARRGWNAAERRMKSREGDVFLVPLVLDRRWKEDRIKNFEKIFKQLARFQSQS
jgi:hypothetical protein